VITENDAKPAKTVARSARGSRCCCILILQWNRESYLLRTITDNDGGYAVRQQTETNDASVRVRVRYGRLVNGGQLHGVGKTGKGE
jgi:hypothetical protein